MLSQTLQRAGPLPLPATGRSGSSPCSLPAGTVKGGGPTQSPGGRSTHAGFTQFLMQEVTVGLRNMPFFKVPSRSRHTSRTTGREAGRRMRKNGHWRTDSLRLSHTLRTAESNEPPQKSAQRGKVPQSQGSVCSLGPFEGCGPRQGLLSRGPRVNP